jgi:hypothetical protein
MIVGLDFDNTLSCYDHVFAACARRRGWLPACERPTKASIRDHVRTLAGGDVNWQILQGEVYGPHMADAALSEGVEAFLTMLAARGIRCYVISHKTRHAPFDPTRTDLRAAALAWMREKRLLRGGQGGLAPEHVFFEETRAAKIARIASLGCSHFVDDLAEVFQEPAFPREVTPILYAPGPGPLPAGRFRAYRSFAEIADALL